MTPELIRENRIKRIALSMANLWELPVGAFIGHATTALDSVEEVLRHEIAKNLITADVITSKEELDRAVSVILDSSN